MTLAQVAAATGGAVHGPPGSAAVVVDGVVDTDSRLLGPGGLFVARVGERADGHEFAADAAAHGAVAALCARPVAELPSVVVADVERAFGRLARAVVDAAPDLSVVGVTGSSGKTSTKDLLAQLLSRLGPTVAPLGSYNSEIGVPLTVTRVTPETRYLVAEMGARGIGHIAYLTEIAPPDIAVVLNVGAAHLGEFGSRESVAKAKSELVQALSPSGVAVLNADDPAVRAMSALTPARVVLVGEAADAAVRAERVGVDEAARARFELVSELPGATGRAEVRLLVHGRHHVANALSAAAVALTLGLPLSSVAEGLGLATATSPGRMEVVERADGVTVVNDAYNANPESMRAAFEALAAMSGGRRSWAVVGEIRELGAESAAAHARLAGLAAELGIGRLVVVGDGARAAYDAALARRDWAGPPQFAADLDAAEAVLDEGLEPGDIVLLKSSRDSGLRVLAGRLVGPVAARPANPGARG